MKVVLVFLMLTTFKVCGNCITCDYPCASCGTSCSNCTLCQDNLFEYNGFCLEECPSGTMPTGLFYAGGHCLPCKSPCAECEWWPTTCTVCEVGHVFSVYGYCVPCDPSCLSCSGESYVCASCNYSSFLTSDATCVPCSPECETCYLTPDSCMNYTFIDQFEINSPIIVIISVAGFLLLIGLGYLAKIVWWENVKFV